MTATIAPERPTRRRPLETLGTVLLLFVLGAVIPVAIAAHYGALDVPRSDDWSYLLTLFRWVDTGTLDFNGWASMTLVGQLVIAAPLVAVVGRSITAVHVLSAFVSFLGLVAVVWMGRLLVRPALAVLVAVTIAASPLWGPMATTYMTDNWAFTFQIAALALAFEAFRRRPLSIPWFAASMAVGVVAVSIRQYAVIPVVAVALVAALQVAREHDRARLLRVLAVIAVAGLAAVAVVAVWSAVPSTKLLTPKAPSMRLLRRTVKLDTGYLRLFGVLLAPVVLAAGPLRLVRRAWEASRLLSVLVVATIGGWMVLQYSRLPNVPFVGNYFAREGVLAQDVLAGVRPPVIPDLLFDALTWVGMVSILVILLAMVPFVRELPGKLRRRTTLPDSPEVAVLGLSLLGFAIAYTVATLTDLPVFDRYALPLLPMLAFLLLRSAEGMDGARREDDTSPSAVDTRRSGAKTRARMVLAVVSVSALALVGFAYTADSASFDATRWSVGEMVVAQGYSPLQVDEGFEWVGWHREQGPPWRLTIGFSERRRIRKIFTRPFCVKVSIGRKVAERFVIASAVSKAPTRRPARIVARKIDVPCVPGRPVGVAELLAGLGDTESVRARALRALKNSAAAVDRLRPPRRGVVVLIYHRVGGRSGLELDLSRERFEEQMAVLADSGRVTTLDAALDALEGSAAPALDPVVVTVDDGTADFVDVAMPVLAQHHVPATLYLATAFVDEQRNLPYGAPPVSWGGLRDVLGTGLLTVGSHTHTHVLLDRASPRVVTTELDTANRLIEDELGVLATHFAYPKSLDGSAAARGAVAERYRSAALAGTRSNPYGATDRYRLARSPIQASDGMRWFHAKVAGGMALEDDARRLLNRVRYAGREA